MKHVQGFEFGFYEAGLAGLNYVGSSQELLLFSDIEILNPDEFVERFQNISNDDWIGAWFGEEDESLWLQLFD